LGLYIAKSIVERHGGTIDARSGSGRTRFAVKLPVEGGA
jgi:signal transduction histidine kinase